MSLGSGLGRVIWTFILTGSRPGGWPSGRVQSPLKGGLLSRYRIGPEEVETALTEHPAVTEAAVISSPDPIRGEVMGGSGLGGQIRETRA